MHACGPLALRQTSANVGTPSQLCRRSFLVSPGVVGWRNGSRNSRLVVKAEDDKSAEYNRTMKRAMEWTEPYTYHHERGLYYHYVSPSVIVGTQPQTAGDVDRLHADEGITAILNLQEDKDIRHWKVDVEAIKHRCVHHDVLHLRRPAKDFDVASLRAALPGAVAALEHATYGGGRAYVHCTAGLGRAPAVCIAYLYWFGQDNPTLDGAYEHVTSRRPCGPKKEAIRGATFDLATGGRAGDLANMPPDAFSGLSADERSRIQYKVLQIGLESGLK